MLQSISASNSIKSSTSLKNWSGHVQSHSLRTHPEIHTAVLELISEQQEGGIHMNTHFYTPIARVQVKVLLKRFEKNDEMTWAVRRWGCNGDQFSSIHCALVGKV